MNFALSLLYERFNLKSLALTTQTKGLKQKMDSMSDFVEYSISPCFKHSKSNKTYTGYESYTNFNAEYAIHSCDYVGLTAFAKLN